MVGVPHPNYTVLSKVKGGQNSFLQQWYFETIKSNEVVEKTVAIKII